MIKRPIWTSGWASLCLPVGWFGVTCPFCWEPPERVARLLRSLLPGGPQVPAHSSPSAWGRACARQPAFRGRAGGLGGGRLFLLRSSALCADDLCLTSVSCPHAESSWCNFSEDKCQSSSCSCAGCGGCARRLGGEKSPWAPAGSLSAGLGVSLCEPRLCGPGRSRSSRRRPLGVLPGSIAGSFALPRPLPPLRLLCASRYLQYFTCPCLLSHVGL